MLLDVRVVGLDRLPILRQPCLTALPVDLRGQSILGIGLVRYALAGFHLHSIGEMKILEMNGGGGGRRTHIRETRIEGFYARIPDVWVLAVRVLEQGTPARRGAPSSVWLIA